MLSKRMGGVLFGIAGGLLGPLPALAQTEPTPADPTIEPRPADPLVEPANGNGNGNGNGDGNHEQAPPAEPEPVPTPQAEPAPMEPVDPYAPAVTEEAGPMTGYGVHISLGGGVTNFTDGDARSLTDVGGTWNLRVALGTRSIASFEAAYVGSAQNTEAFGLDEDAYMVGNGLEGALRINIPLQLTSEWFLEPFGLAGVGWTRYDLVNEDINDSVIRDDDNILTIPLGVGLAASYLGFMFDTRFTFRPAFDDDFLGGGEADLHSWSLTANVGREF